MFRALSIFPGLAGINICISVRQGSTGKGIGRMMSVLFVGMVLFSFVSAAFGGAMPQLSEAILSESANAVQLVLKILGSICLWSGVMEVAEASGITRKLASAFSPVTRLLFRGLEEDSPAMRAITMNFTANLLGLGNAATPFGIRAVRELAKQPRKDSSSATDNIILFVVLNTASFQMIPTTTVLLRASANSSAPMEVAPAIWLASAVSVSCGIAAAKLFALWGRRNRLG